MPDNVKLHQTKTFFSFSCSCDTEWTTFLSISSCYSDGQVGLHSATGRW